MPPLSHYIMSRFLCASQAFLPLSSLCKMLIASVWSFHISYIFLLKCFCHLSCFFMQKVGILKLFRCCYSRRWICQILIHIWYNDEDQPDGHCCLIRVPGHCMPLCSTSHFPHPHWHFLTPQRVLMIDAGEQNSQVLDQDSKHKVKLHEITESLYIKPHLDEK